MVPTDVKVERDVEKIVIESDSSDSDSDGGKSVIDDVIPTPNLIGDGDSNNSGDMNNDAVQKLINTLSDPGKLKKRSLIDEDNYRPRKKKLTKALYITDRLAKYTYKGALLLEEMEANLAEEHDASQPVCNVPTVQNVAIQIANGELVFETGDDKMRRLRLKTGQKMTNWFFCTECGQVLYFHTTNNHRGLVKHKLNCSAQLIGEDKVAMTRKVFSKVINKVMEIGNDCGVSTEWEKKSIFQNHGHLLKRN